MGCGGLYTFDEDTATQLMGFSRLMHDFKAKHVHSIGAYVAGKLEGSKLTVIRRAHLRKSSSSDLQALSHSKHI